MLACFTSWVNRVFEGGASLGKWWEVDWDGQQTQPQGLDAILHVSNRALVWTTAVDAEVISAVFSLSSQRAISNKLSNISCSFRHSLQISASFTVKGKVHLWLTEPQRTWKVTVLISSPFPQTGFFALLITMGSTRVSGPVHQLPQLQSPLDSGFFKYSLFRGCC